MSRLPRALWELAVGDDWTLAVGVAVALAATALLTAAGIASWWVAPVLVPFVLFGSVRRALRRGY